MRTTEQQTRDDKQPDIDAMRYDLAEREAMNMPVSSIIDMLIYGCEALEDMPEDGSIFGELVDFFGLEGDGDIKLLVVATMEEEDHYFKDEGEE
jgi:hypothetical protein